jgi:hypothetical protein
VFFGFLFVCSLCSIRANAAGRDPTDYRRKAGKIAVNTVVSIGRCNTI